MLRGINDLDDRQIDRVLARARDHENGSATLRSGRWRPIVGLAFLEASLRTRIGFAVAAHRLDWGVVEVVAAREGPASQPEPWTETLRVLTGMVQVVVTRTNFELRRSDLDRWAVCPVINGGDRGPDAEHPTQALIDAYAIERFIGPIQDLAVGVCGDLRMRASRSFLRFLALRPPRLLAVYTDPSILEPSLIPDALLSRVEFRELPNVDDLDLLSALGLPDGATDPTGRKRLQVDRESMNRLPTHAAVFSPMPVLDEVETAALDHPRIRLYDQSDAGVFVRMAILEEIIGWL